MRTQQPATERTADRRSGLILGQRRAIRSDRTHRATLYRPPRVSSRRVSPLRPATGTLAWLEPRRTATTIQPLAVSHEPEFYTREAAARRLGVGKTTVWELTTRGVIGVAYIRVKFAAYQRYSSSVGATRDYAGFPTKLVVTAGPAAEVRLAEAAASVETGLSGTVRVFLTTIHWLLSRPAGALGPIWRTPAGTDRQQWWCRPGTGPAPRSITGCRPPTARPMGRMLI
jgi:hypothetical protein